MRLDELIADLPVQLMRGTADVEIDRIVEDSRGAAAGSLFIARTGVRHDGRMFIGDALARGAIAILSDDPAALPEGVTGLLAADVPRATALLAERFHGAPSSRMKLVGVTGTNGKTTTAHLVHHLLNSAGRRCGMLGTVRIDDGAAITPTRLTTPPSLEISALLRRMVDHGCTACVMEASSHAMHQQRTAALAFDAGVFTNLTGDHMDYHGTPRAYLQAKSILFRQLPPDGWAIINIDDPASRAIFEACSCPVLTTSLHDESADAVAVVGAQSITGVDVTMRGPWGSIQVRLPLIGQYNVCNALQAAAVAHVLGLAPEEIRRGLADCTPPPGRVEPVRAGESDVTVLVDYAHTDDALENVLGALRPVVPAGARLITVFGCGGDRDRTKRPRMARAACRWSDRVIVTSDNPRTEDPQSIIDEILSGVPADRAEDVECRVARRDAIRRAIESARAGDVVLIAGKGHEDYQIVGRDVRHFDDREEAAAALRCRGAGACTT